MSDDTLKSIIAQTWLARLGIYTYTVDGDWGRFSKAAARRWYNTCTGAILAAIAPAYRPTPGTIPSDGRLRTFAAQILLADGRFYPGKVDGDWGPLSRAAARAWDNRNRVPHKQSPYDVARIHIGVREIPGKQHNPTILNWYRRLVISIWDDETPWCSTFVNFCALETGYERTGKLDARSWLDVGETIGTDDARKGDVIIFERGNSNWQGHVAFIDSMERDRGIARCLGGNQSDSVNIQTYPLSKLLGVRRLRTLDQLQGGSNKI